MNDCLVIGNSNAAMDKDVFPLFKNGRVRFGNSYVKEFVTWFGDSEKFGNVCWYTTFPVHRKPLVLTHRYDPEKYPKYDNYDAINVDKVKEIPYDYSGVIGVPISFLEKYCTEQFEIVGKSGLIDYAENECEFFVRPSEENAKKYKSQDKTWRVQNTYIVENGVAKTTYSRLFIRKRNEK